MTPNAQNFNPDPAYLRGLIEKAGISQREAARRLGISERHMRAFLANPATTKSAQQVSYPVQYCLEILAATNTDS